VTTTTKKAAKFESAEVKFVRCVVSYSEKSKIININIREDLNIFNLNEWKTGGFQRKF
jgi:hypothetical protein